MHCNRISAALVLSCQRTQTDQWYKGAHTVIRSIFALLMKTSPFFTFNNLSMLKANAFLYFNNFIDRTIDKFFS
jgi:hypothetical protein